MNPYQIPKWKLGTAAGRRGCGSQSAAADETGRGKKGLGSRLDLEEEAMLCSESELYHLPWCGLAASSRSPAVAFPLMGHSWVVVAAAVSECLLHARPQAKPLSHSDSSAAQQGCPVIAVFLQTRKPRALMSLATQLIHVSSKIPSQAVQLQSFLCILSEEQAVVPTHVK